MAISPITNNRKITLLILVIIIAFSLLLFENSRQSSPQFKSYTQINHKIEGKDFKLYVADTPIKQQKGLSGVKSLRIDEGMIFIFPQKGYYAFWMKDMNFSLDFIFLDDNNIVDIIKNVSPSSDPQIIKGSKPYNKVIEINSGVL